MTTFDTGTFDLGTFDNAASATNAFVGNTTIGTTQRNISPGVAGMGTNSNILHLGLTRQLTITATITDIVVYCGSLNQGDVYLKGMLVDMTDVVPAIVRAISLEVYLPNGSPFAWRSLPFAAASVPTLTPRKIGYIITCRATNNTNVCGIMSTTGPTLPWQQEVSGVSYASPPSDLSGLSWVTTATENWSIYGNFGIQSIPFRGHGPYG